MFMYLKAFPLILHQTFVDNFSYNITIYILLTYFKAFVFKKTVATLTLKYASFKYLYDCVRIYI